jgi:TRAP transporter TAXI family solute receptor
MRIQKIALVVTALLLTLTGVQAAISAPTAKAAETVSTIKVDKTKWPRGITVSSAAIGGVYYAWAAGWQKVLTQKINPLTNVEVTGGSVQNIQLVDEGKSTFGIIGSSHSFEGWNGHDWAKGRKFQNIRLVLPMYSVYIQGITLEKSGIKKLQDLEGKAVGLGPKGGGGDVNVRAMLRVLQIKPKRIVNAGWDDMNDQMKDGLLDAQLTSAGAPQASFAELETTQKVVFFGVSSEDAKKIIAEYPYYIENTMRSGVYKALKEPVPTLSGWVMTICNKELPEDFVYTVVKETYANQDVIASAHPVGKEMPMERAASSPIPLHSGALKYYREKGITFPDQAYPPEFKK